MEERRAARSSQRELIESLQSTCGVSAEEARAVLKRAFGELEQARRYLQDREATGDASGSAASVTKPRVRPFNGSSSGPSGGATPCASGSQPPPLPRGETPELKRSWQSAELAPAPSDLPPHKVQAVAPLEQPTQAVASDGDERRDETGGDAVAATPREDEGEQWKEEEVVDWADDVEDDEMQDGEPGDEETRHGDTHGAAAGDGAVVGNGAG